MEQKLIIITGAQGSGKSTYSKEIEKYLKEKGVENVSVFEYETNESENDLKQIITSNEITNTIICIQKDQLHELIKNENRRPFIIIDLDFL